MIIIEANWEDLAIGPIKQNHDKKGGKICDGENAVKCLWFYYIAAHLRAEMKVKLTQQSH